MISTTKRLLLLACFALASCANVTYLPNNPTNNQVLTSARVIYQRLPAIPVNYEIIKTGSGPTTAAERESWKNHHMPVIDRFLANLGKAVPPAVSSALVSRGVPVGDEAIIYLRPTSARSNAVGPGTVLEITVQYKDKAKAPWIASVSSGSSIADSDDSTAARISKVVVDELTKAGFVPKG
jgi:hypothetical protein